MITLHTFGPNFDLPDPSPFVTKAELLLKMSGLPFNTTIGNPRKAPKGKLPVIEENGRQIGDSTLIRLHLEKNHGIDFDKHLTDREKGIAWSVEKMLETNLYWAIVSERWTDESNFAKGPANFFKSIPGPIRPLLVSMIRRGVRRDLHGQGLGRHTRDELTALASRDIDALANVLGDNRYLMGEHPCGADATAFAFAIGVLCPLFDTALRKHAERHANLVAYCDRMRKEFYSDGARLSGKCATDVIAA